MINYMCGMQHACAVALFVCVAVPASDMGKCRIALFRRSAGETSFWATSAAPSVCCKRLFVRIGDGLGTHGCEHRSCLAQAVNIYLFRAFLFKFDFQNGFSSKKDFPNWIKAMSLILF